ncbi:MAG: GNAT family N-acetyltransferase [Defluviitaleaceae bacterium]|nr:GNAT family N-acetyltransferase [Defluviitaleaceae bacterium]
MEFTLYNNVEEFYKDVYDVLLANEAQNTLILGNLMVGYEGKDKFGWRDPANWVMVTVKQDDKVTLVGLMTPPFGLTLYATDNRIDRNTIKLLINSLNTHKLPVPGVVTEKTLAEAFAEEYGLPHKTNMTQRIYKLDSVNPQINKIGSLRLACEQDLFFLPYWIEDFATCAGGDGIVDKDIEKYRYHISQNKLYILEVDGTAVSMAKIDRETENNICISYVYTPPYWRKKGFASSIVAQVSQVCLDKGFKSCVLYTDLANPTSNSIYQEIGYKPVCDSLEITFE